MTLIQSLEPAGFAALLGDLGLAADTFRALGGARPERGNLACAANARDVVAAARELRELGDKLLAADGRVLLFLDGMRTDTELAAWRNELWPWLHVVALYRVTGNAVARETLQGRRAIEGRCDRNGVVLAGRRREHVLSPRATVEKFAVTAGGWNGEPGKPGYAHFRWMRKYVALFGEPRGAKTILDFGCGAGWVGIEAALAAGGAELAAFDPSPELVSITESNARDSGIARATVRVGFGEAPPFDERFDYVVSSGVVSFSPDHARWFDGLVRCAKPGGAIVIGDLNRDSRGMQRRRATRPLLPAREMNALVAAQAREALERRGCLHEATAGYQLTRPIPQLAHWSDTRLGGALSPLLLAYNRRSAGPTSNPARFDSWVMRLRAPK